MRYLLIATFLSLPFLLIACEAFEEATPIPRDKEMFIGTWESKSGFTIEIKASGLADILHNPSQGEPDYERLCIKVGPQVIKGMHVKFKENNILEVLNPLQYGKEYKVDQLPSEEDNQWKMVLNGVTLTRR